MSTYAGRWVCWREIRTTPYACVVDVKVDTSNVLDRRESCYVQWPDEVFLSDFFGSGLRTA